MKAFTLLAAAAAVLLLARSAAAIQGSGLCAAVGEHCQTCDTSNRQCLSCTTGYALRNNKVRAGRRWVQQRCLPAAVPSGLPWLALLTTPAPPHPLAGHRSASRRRPARPGCPASVATRAARPATRRRPLSASPAARASSSASAPPSASTSSRAPSARRWVVWAGAWRGSWATPPPQPQLPRCQAGAALLHLQAPHLPARLPACPPPPQAQTVQGPLPCQSPPRGNANPACRRCSPRPEEAFVCTRCAPGFAPTGVDGFCRKDALERVGGAGGRQGAGASAGRQAFAGLRPRPAAAGPDWERCARCGSRRQRSLPAALT